MNADAQVKWNRAIRIADETGDFSELVSLLQSEVEVTRPARLLLADLFDRHQLKKVEIKKKRGRPRLPVNRRSLTEIKMASAVKAIGEVRAAGYSKEAAENWVREKWGMPLDLDQPDKDPLSVALEGKRGSLNRAKKSKKR